MNFKVELFYCASIIASVSAVDLRGYSSIDKSYLCLNDYSKYLEKHVKALKDFNEKNKQYRLIKPDDIGAFLIVLDQFRYKHDVLKICIDTMRQNSSLEPLFATWDFARQMNLNQKDILFLKEYSILMFYLYENLIIILSSDKFFSDIMKDALSEIIDLYNIVSDLPIKELLLTLEKCFVVFKKILENHGIYSDLSWKQWFKRYWWMAPTILLAVAAVLMRKSKRTSLRRFVTKKTSVKLFPEVVAS